MTLRISFLLAVVSLVLACPQKLLAGGPPWLVLPVDGVNSTNAKACTELLNNKLKDKIWSNEDSHGIQVQQRGKQWYAMFYMAKDVALREVESALQGSGFSVPRDRLRLFGHVVLEIDARSAGSKDVLAALKGMENVGVAESTAKKDSLLVTVDMPYPVDYGRPEAKSVKWDQFQRNDFASDQASRSKSAITAKMLPSYTAVREVVGKHNANLKDIRWSTAHACRPLGCVTATDSSGDLSAK